MCWQDGLSPTQASGGLLNGACGYEALSQQDWPFWEVVSIGPNNPVAYKGNKKGCGYCISATCTGTVSAPKSHSLCQLLTEMTSTACRQWAFKNFPPNWLKYIFTTSLQQCPHVGCIRAAAALNEVEELKRASRMSSRFFFVEYSMFTFTVCFAELRSKRQTSDAIGDGCVRNV